jgi:nucleotide-binding universal stress UspA family protein
MPHSDQLRPSGPVIAAVDPRRRDTAPALLGAQLATLLGARLRIVGTYPVEASVDQLYPEYARTLRLDAERALRSVAVAVQERHPGMDVQVAGVPAQGSPAAALQELAESTRAAALVVGSSARGTAGRLAPGAVTDRLLHGAPCPVAVAPAGYDPDGLPRLIGAAYVDRADGRAAVAQAGAIAGAADARVRVLAVCEPLDALLIGTLDGLALADAMGERERACEAVARAGDALLDAQRSAGARVLAGRTVEALAAASEELDLLVCGSRGHGPLRTLVLGGTSHALVRRAACAVLVVPPGAPVPAAPAPAEPAHALAG